MVRTGCCDVSWVLAERGVLKKSGKRKAESGERRVGMGGVHVQEYSSKGFFWKGFFEQAGRILGAAAGCGLERREERRRVGD